MIQQPMRSRPRSFMTSPELAGQVVCDLCCRPIEPDARGFIRGVIYDLPERVAAHDPKNGCPRVALTVIAGGASAPGAPRLRLLSAVPDPEAAP